MAASQQLPIRQRCDLLGAAAAKNKQNRVKLVLGTERRLIPDCALAKNISPLPLVYTNTDTHTHGHAAALSTLIRCVRVVRVCVLVFTQTRHVLWLIKPEHGNCEWLQMSRRGEDEAFSLVLTCFLTLHQDASADLRLIPQSPGLRGGSHSPHSSHCPSSPSPIQ